MKHEEFNPVLFEEAYDALLERFSEYEEKCPKRRSAATDAQKKADQAGQAPRKQQARRKPEVAKNPDPKPKRKKSCRTPLPTYSETLDFAKSGGRGKPCGASHISASYECRLDAGEREAITKGLVAQGVSKSKLDKLSDEQISAVAEKAKVEPKKVSSGAAATGAGTAHELSLIKELGGNLGKDGEAKLAENMERGGANSQKAAEIAKKNAADLKAYLKSQGMEQIDEVIWTAQLRGDGLAKAAGVKGLNEKNNQSDILIKGRDKDGNEITQGVSLKVATSNSTKYPNDIPFFNGGFAREAGRVGAEEAVGKAKASTEKALKDLGVRSTTASAAKKEIRANPELRSRADAAGRQVLTQARGDMITAMQNRSPDEMRGILSTMTGAPTGEGRGLQTLKLTGYASGKQSTKIEDSVQGRVPTSIANATKFEFEPSGANGIRVIADGVPVMKIRVKYESQPLASSIKLSGEAP